MLKSAHGICSLLYLVIFLEVHGNLQLVATLLAVGHEEPLGLECYLGKFAYALWVSKGTADGKETEDEAPNTVKGGALFPTIPWLATCSVDPIL